MASAKHNEARGAGQMHRQLDAIGFAHFQIVYLSNATSNGNERVKCSEWALRKALTQAFTLGYALGFGEKGESLGELQREYSSLIHGPR